MNDGCFSPDFPLRDSLWIFSEADTDEVNLYSDFLIPFYAQHNKRYLLTLSADADFAVFFGASPLPVFFHGYTDDPAHKVHESFDLTPHVRDGENELKITLFCPNADFSTYKKNRPALRFLLTEDGAPIAKSSEKTLCRRNPYYKSGSVPLVSGQLGFSFDYDGTADISEPWHTAAVVSGMPDATHPRPIPRLDTDTLLVPIPLKTGVWSDLGGLSPEAYQRPAVRMQNAVLDDVNEPVGNYTIYDLTREETGHLLLTCDADEPTEILVGWGEHLHDGRCRTAIGKRNFAARIKLPAGKSEFFAPFLRLGLRYLQIFTVSSTARVLPRIVRAVYPVTEKPYDTPEGTIHREIERVARHTLHLCMHDHYEDCPWREQALYALDGRSEMLAAFYAFGETALSAASLRLMAASIRKDALLELCSPGRVSITIPGFSAAFVIALGEYYAYSGDETTALELQPVAYEILSGFYGRMKHHDWMLPAYRQKEYWNFYEWADGLDGKIGKESPPESMTYDAPLMALVSIAFTAYAKMLTALGQSQNDAEMIDQGDAVLHCSEELNERLNEYFWNEDAGLYCTRLGISLSDGSPIAQEDPHFAELTQVLCVLCGAVDTERLPDLLRRIYQRDGMIPATLSSGIFRYEALLKDAGTYAHPVLDEIEARFSAMLDDGATTFYETEDGASAFSDAGSLCHGWSAFPIYLYARYRDLFFA